MTQALVGENAVDATEWLPSHPGMRAAYQQFMQDFDRREALRTAARRFVREWTTDPRDVERQVDMILDSASD